MPVKVQATPLARTEPVLGLVRAEEASSLLALFDPGTVNEAMRVSGWTVAKEIQLLTEVAEGIADGETGVSASDRMKAAKELRHIGRTVLGLGQGLAVGRSMRTIQTDQGPVTEETHVVRAMGPNLERAAEIIRTQLNQMNQSDDESDDTET